MSDDNVSVAEVLAALEKMDKVFKSFEQAKKAVKYLSGLEQNVRELEAKRAATQAEADETVARCAARTTEALETQTARLLALDSEFGQKRQELETSCAQYRASVEDALNASRSEHAQVLAQLVAAKDDLSQVLQQVAQATEQRQALALAIQNAKDEMARILSSQA